MLLLNNNKPTFLVDAMLGNIAKKLRLLGYDSDYSSSISDDEIILKAKNENRIIITKDEPLVKLAEKQKISTILITKNNESDQLVQIFQSLRLPQFVIDVSSARCTLCNGQLFIISKDQILNKVPKWVLEHTENFWKCNACHKIYWEGSHFIKLQKFVNKLNDEL